jgi:glycerophosphoryl diester phosphodiesterase
MKQALALVCLLVSGLVLGDATTARAASYLTPISHRANEIGLPATGAFELDTRWTSDGVAVTWHDPAYWPEPRCTGPAAGRSVASTSFSEAAQTVCAGATILTLDQVLTLMQANSGLTLWLEPKAGGTPAILTTFSSVKSRVAIQAKTPTELNQAKVAGFLPCYLGRGLADLIGGAKANGWKCVEPDHRDTALTATRVAAAKAVGIQVIPFTVNTQADLLRVCKTGVRTVITDIPELARSVSC